MPGTFMHDGIWSRRTFFRGGLTVAAASAGGLAASGTAYAKSPSSGPSSVLSYVTRPDLRPPRIQITPQQITAQQITAQAAAGGDPAYFLLTTEGPTGQHGLTMVDRAGELVWFRPAAAHGLTKNFNVQVYRGQPVLTWWESGKVSPDAEIGEGIGYIADSAYNLISTVSAGNGLNADFHDFTLTSAGTALITAYRKVTTDLSAFGGSKHGIVFCGVAQEIDFATGAVVFEWNSLDHVPVTETMHRFYPGTTGRPFDYFHINSIGVADDGDLLISGRNTCAVYKVNRTTGAVRWRLGGKKSTFTMGPGATFWWQHDARAHGPGGLSVFDDGASPAHERQSRGLLLDLDTRSRHCSLQRAYTSPARPVAVDQGSMQVLPDGDVIVGWGSEPYFSQFTPSGEQTLFGQLPRGDFSYRTFGADWTGTPDSGPDVVARRTGSGGTVVYMSWNGATQVADWQVSAGSGSSALRPVSQVRKDGFETAIWVGTDGPYFAVTGLDASGSPLGRPTTVRREEG